MKLTKLKLKEIIREEINLLREKSLSKMNTKELIKYWEKEARDLERNKGAIDMQIYTVERGRAARVLNYLWGLQKDMKKHNESN